MYRVLEVVERRHEVPHGVKERLRVGGELRHRFGKFVRARGAFVLRFRQLRLGFRYVRVGLSDLAVRAFYSPRRVLNASIRLRLTLFSGNNLVATLDTFLQVLLRLRLQVVIRFLRLGQIDLRALHPEQSALLVESAFGRVLFLRRRRIR